MTLGMNNIMQGLTLIYSQGTPSGSAPDSIKAIATAWLGPVPVIVLVWIGLAIVASVGLHATRGGRYLYSVGESLTVSRLSGIDNDRVLIVAYTLCGLCAAATGILFTGFSTMSFLGMGDQFVLPSIAAVVLGGASIYGGRGSYVGTFVSAIFLTVLTTILTIANIAIGYRNILYGLVIIAAVLLLPRLCAAARLTRVHSRPSTRHPMSIITKVSVVPFRFSVKGLDLGAHRAMGVSNLRFAPGGTLEVERYAIRIETDDGLSGEYVTHWVGTPAALAQSAMLGPHLLGRNPEHREEIYDDLKRELRAYDHMGHGPLDIALWDLVGKKYGISVAAMLGAYRTRLPTYASTHHGQEGGRRARFARGFRRLRPRLPGPGLCRFQDPWLARR